MRIAIISGSTRPGRLSNRVALALEKQILASGNEASIIDLVELRLPPFEERFKYAKDPNGKLAETAERMKLSDGLIFLTPEYNGAMSSGLKNFIDVFAPAAFEGKPIGVATASAGAFGGIRAAYQLQQTILSVFGYPIPRMLTVGNVDKILDTSGNVIDDDFHPKLGSFLEAYLGFVMKFIV